MEKKCNIAPDKPNSKPVDDQPRRICANEDCASEAAPGRTICWKCKSRQFSKKNPIRKAWHNLKRSAVRREIKFELTLKYFTEWVTTGAGKGYMELAGMNGDDLTIDRIKPELGYVEGNLQLLTRTENSNKFHNEERVPVEVGDEEEKDDLPF